MDFLVTVLNLCLSFSPAEWFTDVVMDFCYVSMFCVFDLIKKDRFIVRGWVGKVKELIDFFSLAVSRMYLSMVFWDFSCV